MRTQRVGILPLFRQAPISRQNNALLAFTIGIILALDAQSLHLGLQGRSLKAESSRRAVRSRQNSSRFLQTLE